MANDAVRLSDLIRQYETKRGELAHAIVNRAMSYESYLQGVGRYRQLLALENKLKDMLKKRPDDEADFDDLPPEQQLGVEDEQPEREPVTARVRARQWGGR